MSQEYNPRTLGDCQPEDTVMTEQGPVRYLRKSKSPGGWIWVWRPNGTEVELHQSTRVKIASKTL